MRKMQILGKQLGSKAVPTAAHDALSLMINAYSEYKKVAAQEETKREAITAWKEARLAELNNQKEILHSYLEHSFKERRHMIDGLFETLDKGIQANDANIITNAMSGIINIAKESPLQQVDKLMLALQDKDTKVIEF